LYVQGRQVQSPLREVMNKPEHFEIMDGYAVFRPSGQVSLEEGVRLVTSVIAFAREHDIKKLLVVTTGLTGFKKPSLADRYFLFREAAGAAQGEVCIALVTRPELIDPEKLGMLVAKNAGLRIDVFASEEAALAWLHSVK
jgi:hypothetical protein